MDDCPNCLKLQKKLIKALEMTKEYRQRIEELTSPKCDGCGETLRERFFEGVSKKGVSLFCSKCALEFMPRHRGEMTH